ncbi:cytochrome P450 [Mycobacterium sp.]|uniref:cytochrome P450 n=1 Tax=Mycobacterium sp. TaxID=1785 RepID=UPI003F98EFD6
MTAGVHDATAVEPATETEGNGVPLVDVDIDASIAANDEHVSSHVAEELLRLETPFPFIGRFTTEEVTIADVTIPAGSVVALCLASTNLDGSETSSVTVTEDGKIRPKRHRSFGAGVHRCLGKALARMELTVIVVEWLRAVPDFELERDLTLSFTFTQGGAVTPSSLPLRWTAARAAPTT